MTPIEKERLYIKDNHLEVKTKGSYTWFGEEISKKNIRQHTSKKDHFIINTSMGELEAGPGDCIIRMPNGELRVEKWETFHM